MEKEIDLRDIILILRRRFWIIVSLPVVAALIAAVMVFFIITPVYEASTTLLVGKNEANTTSQTQLAYQDVLLNQQLVQTYREIARSRSVAEHVISQMGLNMTADQLREQINVSTVTGTQVLRLAVTDTDPVTAQNIANATADAFVKRVPELMKLNNVTIVDQALTPIAPIKPKKPLTIAVAFLVALMTAMGLALLMEYLDNTIKTRDDVETHLGLPVLGMIPKID